MNTRRIPARLQNLARPRAAAPAAQPPVTAKPTEAPSRSTIVDSGIYVDGTRIASPATLPETFTTLNTTPGAMAWIGLYRPAKAQLEALGAEFGLHELAIEDAVMAHQRSKIERYGDTLFVVLRAARYLDSSEEIEFSELHLFVGPNFIITVRHGGSPNLAGVRRRMEADPELLRLGPEAVMYAVLDAVVDGFAPVVAGLANDIDEIETEVFSGDPAVSRRIYELSQQVIQFQRSTHPLLGILASLAAGFTKYRVAEELQQYLRDVADHTAHADERTEGYRVALRDILTVNATLVAQRQNEEMRLLTESSNAQNEEVKKISAWAAILFAPTLVGTVYGMNFQNMPELTWEYGYPLSIALMAGICGALWLAFRRRGWI
jgi:magnesium transporter